MKTNPLILTILAAALAGCASTKPAVQLAPADKGQPALLKPTQNPMAQDSIPVARLHEPVKTMPVPPAPPSPEPVSQTVPDTAESVDSSNSPATPGPQTVMVRPTGTRIAAPAEGQQAAPVVNPVTGATNDDAVTTVVTPVDGVSQAAGQGVSVEPVSRVTNGVNAARAAYVSGKQALGQGNIDQAIDLFTNARNLAPDLVDAHTGLGVALSMAARHDEALPAFQKAVELEPTNAQWHANLGLAHARTGNFLQAQQSLAHAWSLKPGDARIESQLERVTAAARSAGQIPGAASARQVSPTETEQGSQLVQVRERVYDLKLNGAPQAEPVQPVMPSQADMSPSVPVAPAAATQPRRVLRFGAPAASSAANSRAGESATRAARTAAKAIKPVTPVKARTDTAPSAPRAKSPGKQTVPVKVKKAPVSKAPAASVSATKAPVTKTPVVKAPVVKAPVASAPVSMQPARKASMVKSPVHKAPVTPSTKGTSELPRQAVEQTRKAAETSAPALRSPVKKVAVAGKSAGKTKVKSRSLRGLVVVAPDKGAAQRVANFLAAKGLKSGRVGRPSGVHPLTEIHYRPGYERDVQDIRMALPVRTYSVVQTQMPRGVNVQVVVGRDLRKLSGASVTDSAKR